MTTKSQNAQINVRIAKQAVADLQKIQKQFVAADKLLTRANKAVYHVLSSAFDVLVSLKTAEDKEPVRKLFNEQLERMTRNKKAKHATEATSIELKVIRFVCGNLPSKRENSYARVLRVAFAENIHCNNEMTFVEWVIAAGGIDAVRRSGNGKPPVDYAEIARNSLKAVDALAPVAAAHISRAGENEKADADFCVAVVRKNADGTYSIVSTVDNAALTKQALARAGRTLNDKQATLDAAEAEREKQKEAKAATREMLKTPVCNGSEELEAA